MPADLNPLAPRRTGMRYVVLAVLCSLAFLTYLDRICIMRYQEPIREELGLVAAEPGDQAELERAAPDRYASLLKDQDLAALTQRGLLDDADARRQAAARRLAEDRATRRMSWIFSAFLVGYTLFEVPGGWLADRWGPRLVIVRIVVWWSIFTALTGSVDTILRWFVRYPSVPLLLGSMMLVRFLFGVGEAGVYPTIGRTLARWFPYRERAFGQGAIWMASRMGGAASPLLAGWLMVAAGGWRHAFWVLGIVGVLWALGFGWWFRNRPEELPGCNAAERSYIRAEAAGAGTVYDETGHHPLPWKRVFGSLNLWAVYLVAAAVSFSWYINVTFLPQVLKDKFGASFAHTELLTGLPLLISGPFCLLGGVLSDWIIHRTHARRWGRSVPGVIGFSLAGLCLLLVPLARSPEQLIALSCVACAVQDLALPCLWAACADIGGKYAGTLSGTMNSMGGIGGVASPLVGARLNQLFGWDVAYLVYAGSYFVGAAAWLLIDATKPLIRPGDPAPRSAESGTA